MKDPAYTFWGIAVKTIVVHTVTYFFVGLAAYLLFNYSAYFAEPKLAAFMRQTDEPIVALGTALQPIRGLLFALAFFPLRESLFARKKGWLVIWLLLVTLGVFATFGEAPGSVEGLIYTTIPIQDQLSGGLLEALSQSCLLSASLYYWVNHPEKRWLNWVLGSLFVLVISISLAGFLLA